MDLDFFAIPFPPGFRGIASPPLAVAPTTSTRFADSPGDNWLDTNEQHDEDGIQYFPTALDPRLGSETRRRAIRSIPPLLRAKELVMCRFINEITDTKDWTVWIENMGFVNEKTADVLARSSKPKFTKWMAGYCFAELRRASKNYESDGILLAYNGVFKSDEVIEPGLRDDILAQVSVLKRAIQTRGRVPKDSNIIHIIDPTLYPLIFGTTRILDDGDTVDLVSCIKRTGHGEVVESPEEIDETVHDRESKPEPWHKGEVFSRAFQWLPCEVDISRFDIKAPKITSYINNVHPQDHHDLYTSLEMIIGKVIQLWNAVLTQLCYNKYRRWKGPFDSNDPLSFDNVVEPDQDELDLVLEYAETGLQIIVDLVEVELTPEQPTLSSTLWQASGRMNEHICATAIYCLDNDNVIGGDVEFRQPINAARINNLYSFCGDDDMKWLKEYNLEEYEPPVQYLGGTQILQGRILAFSNLLQHCTRSMSLVDPTKPGYRKLLTLHLVDPNKKIISTANVPCQQQDWWAKEIAQTQALKKLPAELRDLTFTNVTYPMSSEEASRLSDMYKVQMEEYRRAYQLNNFEKVRIELQDV